MPTATKKAVKKSAAKPKARLTKAQRVANFAKLLKEIGACRPARAFCKGKTLKEVWTQSPDPFWMTYLFANIYGRDVEPAYAAMWKLIPDMDKAKKNRALCIKIAAKFPIEKFAFYKERGL